MMTNSKYSRQRETLLAVLRNTTCHPGADWIYDRVREEIPNISLGTVYRNLSKLLAEGVIQKIDIGGGSDRFDGDVSPHSHLVCNDCGKIVDIYSDYSELLKNDAKTRTGAEIETCSVVFKGICSDCVCKISQ